MDSLQKAAWTRKGLYLAAIVLLFTISMVWRGVLPVPLSGSLDPARWAQAHTIQSQAERLEVWELDPNEGEADVSGSAVRLALTGSRGFAVTVTWLSAIEKQKRNDFHEFEQRVQLVTKLQPNFISPWIFQSWNITYNVSVEMHGSGDMYYYIVRGIQLLAEGERRNKRSPDMRYQIAFYYQNKFGVSDQVEVLRCLFDLSCMPWTERNPANLVDPTTKEINYEAFKKFCEKHPHFVRRLRGEDTRSQEKKANEKLRAPEAMDVISFLRTNQEIPSRYKVKGDELTDAEKQFPVLPPAFNEEPDEANPTREAPFDQTPGLGYFSAFKVARAWFSYSLLLLPPPIRDEQGNPLPGPTPPPGQDGHDPSKHRVPRMPMLIIFRQGAPRAQSYQAELEQKEGWFDKEGWRIEGWFDEKNYPGGVVVGSGKDWSLDEWRKAYTMWRRHGDEYGLDISSTRLESLRKIATDPTALQSASDNPDDPVARRRIRATNALQYYQSNRSTTNYPYFIITSSVEKEPGTVQAHKLLWQAEQARKIGESPKAIRLYKEGLEQWKRILIANPVFHRMPPPDRGDRVEEETYEYELAYQRLLVLADERVRDYANKVSLQIKGAHALTPFRSVAEVRATYKDANADTIWRLAPFQTEPFPKDEKGQPRDPVWTDANREEIKWFVVESVGDADFSSPFVGGLVPSGDWVGTPWIREDIKESVRSKQGVTREKKPPPGQATAPQPPAPPGPP